MSFTLGDYVDVPTRLQLALAKWPELRIQESTPVVVIFEGREWIQISTTVWRSPDDTLPAIASAWEPKGTTPYTRDSEMMNCSTSSLGRALGLMGIVVGKSIATSHDVQLRQENSNKNAQIIDFAPSKREPQTHTPAGAFATPKQLGYIKKLAKDAGLDDLRLLELIQRTLNSDEAVLELLKSHEASKIIEVLR